MYDTAKFLYTKDFIVLVWTDIEVYNNSKYYAVSVEKVFTYQIDL